MESFPFTHQPVYSTIFWGVYLLWVVPEVVRVRRLRSPADARKRDRRSLWFLLGAIAVGIATAFLAPSIAPAAAVPGRPSVIFGAAITLMLAGIALRQWAIHTLGRFFTFDVATQAKQPVVRSGPYRLIRHPGYSGGILTLFGVGLALGNWLSVAALMLGATVGYLYRIPVEERALCEDLGEPYREYMRCTRRFIPFVF